MENPRKEIEGVIRQLTQTGPSDQKRAVQTYFTADASFTHPFCRTGSFQGSRQLIETIYRWYKILSPHIDLNVDSVAYDEASLILYVTISQVFSIFLVPFYSSSVQLTTVLQLKHDSRDQKYYITSQNDLYQVDQWVKFFLPGGYLLIYLWHFIATFMCVLGAYICQPITWLEENRNLGSSISLATAKKGSQSQRQEKQQQQNGEQEKQQNGEQEQQHSSEELGHAGLVEQPKGSGHLVTAPAVQQR